MRKAKLLWILIAAALVPASSFGQTQFGLGVSAGTLGVGVQGALSVTQKSNIRVGGNFFSYSDTFSKDGVTYSGTLKLRSAQVTYDQFFGSLFHISPGALIYNNNQASGTASIPGGQTFTLGGTQYYSSAANPVTGTASLPFGNKAAPMILFGIGNLVPRGQKHFGFNLEAGVVYQGSPNATLNLGGSSCLTGPSTGCVNTATDPGVQANVKSEQNTLNNDLKIFKIYPVVSLSFGYKF
jgi:hypothetical protein